MIVHCPNCRHAVDVGKAVRQPLTKRQAEVYRYCAEYTEAHGYAPSFEDVAAKFGFASLSTVHEHLENIERKGWITRQFNEARGITCLVDVSDIGTAAAGAR